MVLDSRLRELSGMLSGLTYDDRCSEENSMARFRLNEPRAFLDHDTYTSSFPQMIPAANSIGNFSSNTCKSIEGEGTEDCEIISDVALNYISRMLMEEDIDEKVSTYQEEAALRAAAKPFYDILGQKFPPPPDRQPILESPNESGGGGGAGCCCGSSSSSNYTHSTRFSGSSGMVDNCWFQDSKHSKQSRAFPVSVDHSSQPSISSSSSGSNVVESFEEPLITSGRVPEFLIESLPAWHFRKGVEEAQKFLPSSDKLIIDLEATGISFPRGSRKGIQSVKVKAEVEEKESGSFASKVRKNPNSGDLDLMEGRSNKQSAIFSEEPLRSEMFDMVLLCQGEKSAKKVTDLRELMKNEANKNSSETGQTKGLAGGARSRGRKQNKREVVDLRTLLIHCAQAVAADDRRTANELLKQIRQHSSPNGDGSQRLAYCIADGLEARLAGTGSQIYHKLVAKRTTATDMLKAYHLYLAACPFKKVSHFFSNQTILNVAEKAKKVHIIDFGIFFGFQWPCLIQRLSNREGGPPTLRITGIDVPQPGFRPTERIEETGRRLAEYAKKFRVPFEYQAIASKWETIRVEDLKINEDEVIIVNCLYRFRNLIDETVAVDSPRNRVLNTIRQMNPNVFINGIVNGSYSAPFFVTRFREALFHFSALFDMLETNVPRENEQRLLIERELFGREALNVIACEGSERVERPETYKQWQVRNLRAGFEQLPLNPEIKRRAKEKVRAIYHKDFVIDEDCRWLLQGWKGRIIYAISTWRPNVL